MSRRTATETEKSARRSHILDCARRLFAENGYRATTMGLVADAAQMSVGALYLSFPGGKDELCHALYEQALDRLAAAFDEAFALPATDVRGRICILLYAYICFFKDEGDSYRILNSLFTGEGGALPEDDGLRAKREAILCALEEPIAQGIQQGVIRATDTRKTVVSLWCMFNGILGMSYRTDLFSFSARFRDYYVHGINIILDGLFR